jgi:hypothetical protein
MKSPPGGISTFPASLRPYHRPEPNEPLKIFETPFIDLAVQTGLLFARARKQAPRPKKAGRNPPKTLLFVSSKRRGGKGITRLKRREPASGKKGTAAFFDEANDFWPGHGIFYPAQESLFAQDR